MISSTTKSFRSRYEKLPLEVRQLAHKNFKLWLHDPHHPSIQFKKAGKFWSARVGLNYRALALMKGEACEWFWIGPHDEYEFIIGTRR